ncbi:Choline/ethanolamine kinase [Mycoplasmopsis agassizii]|uniref:Protein kinase domain-containing protein n=1 Tax=Mycoplasmopsis agassizii TaxID=33922 RepID=A0ABX4H4N2_9BACT|nr:hypothetical protein CJF60_03890 [Mycoplasmopsis agassizii]SMC18596.1 Choline/ethanolamine kinase [Mycoplasmopsis agassizii]
MLYIKRKLPKKIFKQISKIKFHYKGFHNRTYIAYLNDVKVQIRIAINKIADHKDEIIFLKNNEDYIYVTPYIAIKKWYEGDIYLKKYQTKESDFLLLDELQKVWKTNLNLSKMNWHFYKTKDKKYLEIVDKYKDDFNEVIHGDVRPKNTIFTTDKKIKLIDFEWTRKGSKYFDIVSFLKFSILTKDEIIDYLKLDKEKLEDYIYIVNLFNKTSYEVVYDHIKDFYVNS